MFYFLFKNLFFNQWIKDVKKKKTMRGEGEGEFKKSNEV